MSNDLTLVIANKSYSSWSLRPWLCLAVFDIPFEEVVIPLAQPDTSARIREHSPAGRVPVLHHGGITVWESLAILDYLAESFYDRNLWPADPHAKAHARAISAEMHAGFQALRSAMPMNLRRLYQSRDWDSDVRADIERIKDIWSDALVRFGNKDEPFLFGKFSIADAMFAPVVTRFKTYGIRLDEVSQTYADAILSLPAMERWYDEAVAEPWEIAKYDVD